MGELMLYGDIKIESGTSTIDYLPKWKIWIGRIFNIPIRPRFHYRFLVETKHYEEIINHDLYRLSISGHWVHCIYKGTPQFADLSKHIFETAKPINLYFIGDHVYENEMLQRIGSTQQGN